MMTKTRVAIAASSLLAAQAGAFVTREKGNAVDAAVASTLVSICTELGIMAPGAGGFITLWDSQGTSEPVTIDAYVEMPGRGLNPQKQPQNAQEVIFEYGGLMKTRIGYGSIATPGILAGLEMAIKRYGELSWPEVIAPTQQLTENGFPLSWGAAEYLKYTHDTIFSWHPQSYHILHHHNGSLVQAGEIITLPQLSQTLKTLAHEGVAAFYTGAIGDKIAGEILDNGGLITTTDLASYHAIERQPIRFECGEWEVATNPVPSIGGACLAAIVLLFEKEPVSVWNEDTVKRLVEVQQAVLNFRYHHFHDMDSKAINLKVSQLLNLAEKGHLKPYLHSPSTIHTSAVDSEGLACSISASAGYGSGVIIPETGLWFNNTLGELELHPDAEQLSPGIRLVSNMAPTVARKPDGSILAIGSPGASRIATALAQVFLNFIHQKMSLSQAIAYPRLHVEILSEFPTVSFEVGLPVNLGTEWITQPFPQPSMYFGGVQAAYFSPETGFLAVADSRREGGVAYQGIMDN
ncbi:Gamma-glutamyltransferase [Gloeothece citriformis PCC 7424]|uniref:Gamma-glutamyltransferase n=1 Tax=Gloeothece citriformis (strain PCC 7424) TaxID=65393 RepID=B7KIG0_GLOC7|nr:gamma-glutamyltransferase [Gloeothece citriformis]ACK69366.1 Gamma-glutamyltransferase [Gloeothece citriformis PCC 7424]